MNTKHDVTPRFYKNYLISLYTDVESKQLDLAYHQFFYGSLFIVSLLGVLATQLLTKRNVGLQMKSKTK